MIQGVLKYFLFTVVLLFSWNSKGQLNQDEQHILVAMRMIGHEILLNANNTTSRILPIGKKGRRYKIEFDSEFEFSPEITNSLIDSVIRATEISNQYVVEFRECDKVKVVYSYEVGKEAVSDIIPCKGRTQPKGCYDLYITLLDLNGQDTAAVAAAHTKYSTWSFIFAICTVLLFVLMVLFILKFKKGNTKIDPNVISIGKYLFNKNKMELILKEERIELTSKEADLLQLLYEAVNKTVERDIILKEVWGDEGDYVGRTLDVFISKLRKKLQADANVKIANIRGVGYKLIMDVPA